MRGWSENDVNDANNADVFNEDDYLDAMIENNHEQEYCDNDLSHPIYPSDCISQKYSKEKGKFSTESLLITYQLKYIPKELNLKIQYLQVDHPREIFQYSPEREPTDKELVPSSSEREPTDKELVLFSPKIGPTDKELVLFSAERKPTGKELVLFSAKRESTDKELVLFSPKIGPTDKELVLFSAKRKPTGKELVLFSPTNKANSSEREPTGKELVPSSPEPTYKEVVPSSSEKEPTGRELVPSSPENEPTYKEVVPSSSEKEPPGRKLVPFSPKRETTDKEIGPFSPKKEPTSKELVPFTTEKESTDKEVVPSSSENEPTCKELVPSSLEKEPACRKLFPFSPERETTDKEIGPSSPEKEPTGKELVPFSPKKEPTGKEVVPSSSEKEPPGRKLVPFSPKRETTDKEIGPSSPEKETTGKELVPFSTERETIDKEINRFSLEKEPTGKELVPFSPERETTDKKIGPSSPEKEPTGKELVSFSPKKEPTDKELVPSSLEKEPIGRKLVPFSFERETTDKEINPFSSKKEPTDKELVPSSLEKELTSKELVPFSTKRETTDEEIVPFSPEKWPTGKELVPFSPEIETTGKELVMFSHKNGSIHKRATPYIVNKLNSFIWIPLVLVMFSPVSMATNGVNIFPTKTVGVPGDNFNFFCSDLSRTALSVQWLVNGTLLENSRLVNVFREYNSRSKTANLNFDLPMEHNITTIQCIYNFPSENVSSGTITLLLQGLLAAVGSPSVDLVGTDISLTWIAPFTLDISYVDPDITYCVDVVNSTSSSRVLSECGITVTGFNFSIPIGRVCDNYTFTVTPVNVAGNGTAGTLGYSHDLSPPRASEGLLLPISESTYQITMTAPVCYGELTVINNNTGDETHIQGSELNITMNIIMFTSEKLKKNQLYTVSVNASNINGSVVSYVSLSTHDVMKATFDFTYHTITTEYFEYSTAMGALYIFIFINEDTSIDFKKSIYLPLDRSSSHNYTLPEISPGQYHMFVYDIDRDVTLHDSVSYPANTNMFSIISNGSQASYSQRTSSELLDCSVIYVDDVISAMCSYSGGSSVTGFQMIVQLNNVDEVHKLYINGTTKHLSPGPVTVRVEESGTYHVAIFLIMGERGIVDTNIAYSEVLSVTNHQTMMPEISKESSQGWIIAVGGVVTLLLLIIIIVGVRIVYIYLKNNSTAQSIRPSTASAQSTKVKCCLSHYLFANHILKHHTSSSNECSELGAVNSNQPAIPLKQEHKISTTEPLDKCDFGAEHGQAPSDYLMRVDVLVGEGRCEEIYKRNKASSEIPAFFGVK